MNSFRGLLAVVLVFSGVSPSLAAYVNASTQQNGSGTTATLNAPSSPTSGNVLTAVLYNQYTGRTITPPAGWTLQSTLTKTAINRDQNSVEIRVYTRIADGTETTFAFGISPGSDWVGWVTQHSGRNTSAPITATATTDANGIGGTSQTYNLTGVTAAAGDDLMWLAFGNSGASGAVFTKPSGYTDRGTNAFEAYGISAFYATSDGVGAGATGTLSGSESGVSCDIGGIVIAIAQASGGGSSHVPVLIQQMTRNDAANDPDFHAPMLARSAP